MKLTRIFTAIIAVAGLTLGASAYAADTTTLTPGQKAQVETIIHDYIMKNPDVVIEAVKGMQEKQFDQMRQKTQEVALKKAGDIFNAAIDPVVGNPKGKVTLVEFFDYQCPHCVDMAPAIEGLVKSNAGLRVVLKEFPIRGEVSVYAAKAALAANKQGKYWEFHQALMKSGSAAPLTDDSVLAAAKSVGLDMDKLKTDMNSDAVDQQVKGNYKLAQDLQLMGTPALFIAKTTLPKDATPTVIEFIPGQVDQKYLQSSIDKASH